MMRPAREPKWYLFFDFHTMPACPDVGANFDVDAFTDRVKACGADYIVFPARCNQGMAYYDTKVGIRHPSLQYDLFGKLAEACRSKEIALTAYVNVGLSHEEGLRHREWLILTQQGYTYGPDRLNSFFRMMCYNSGYGDHVLEMVREIVQGYPVAGLFLDCMRQPPCVGEECVREMKQLGMDWKDKYALDEFANVSRVRMTRRIAEAARTIRPELLLHFNGINYEDQLEWCSHLEYECLPTGGWGYDARPAYARYMRTLGKPVFNMTGRFHKSWGDFGGIRTESSLEYDCLDGLSHGMRVCVGDHVHPRGDINRAVSDLVKRVYTRLQALEPWLNQAQSLVDMAVIPPKGAFNHTHADAHERAWLPCQGAARLLAETKAQFDILTERSPWEGYRLLVLADEVLLDEASAGKVREHLRRGGAVLSTGWSGLDPQKKGFALKEWGLEFEGEDPFDPAYILMGPEISRNMPDMPITLYERGTAIRPLDKTDVLAHIMAPYYSRHWDGEHGFVYLPPDKATDRAAVTRRGAVAHVSHPVFTAYYRHAPIPMRQLVANLLAMLLSDPLVKAPDLPSFARATVTGQPGRRMVHLLSYVPERRGERTDMIEEPIVLSNVRLSLRVDGRPPKQVYLAPTRQKLEFAMVENYVQVKVPVVPGYAMIVFED